MKSAAQAWRQIPWFLGVLWWASPWAVTVNVGLVVVVAVIPTLATRVSGLLFDALTALRAPESVGLAPVYFWVGVLVGLQLISAGLGALRGISRARLRERAGVRLQQLVIERAGNVPLEQYEQAEFYDRLQRAQQAATWRSFVIFENMLRTLELAINAAGSLILLLAGHVAIPIILAVGALPMVISHLKRGRETYELHRSQTPTQRRAQYHVELLTNREAAKELRLNGLSHHLLGSWERLASRLRQERLQLTVRQQLRLGLARLTSSVTYIASIGILIRLSLLGHLTVGDVLYQMQSANRFPNQLTQVLRNLSTMFEELLYLSDLREFTELPAEAEGGSLVASESPSVIEFDNVSFNYPDGPSVIKSLSFCLEPGEKIALVGSNGAGKTTLIKLLLGLYHPTEGRILVDGIDVRDLEPDSLRKKSAAVFQDFLRYQLTARQNISFGRAERAGDDARVTEAAEAGGADQLIGQLPNGYDTILGRHFEGGQDLSGGQWQRLAISRSYFRDAHILVLDEPTAALDPRAELAVFQEFRRLAEGKTAIFVSHRMASARIADRIMVMDSGRLIEMGHHDELLALGGEYARMFTLQARWYLDDFDVEAAQVDLQSPGYLTERRAQG